MSERKRLERLYQMSGSTEGKQEQRAEQRAELLARLQEAKVRATLAAAAGDTRRLHALEDLERHMLEGMERGQEGGD